jgi:SAM-dependent methyltransferase
MRSDTREALASLNRAFYDRFAGDFARTRRSWPPGFDAILPHLGPAFNVADVGCGNGRLLLFLYERGWRGGYVGIDSSAALLAIARENCGALPGVGARFVQADLLDGGWAAEVGQPDALALLAVLHHIPGSGVRARLVAEAASALAPGGILIVSTWQFLASTRLRAHILPWSRAGISEADVEAGDYLLSWGQGAAGERYVAAIDAGSLTGLAAAAGLQEIGVFESDGLEGNLNLYGVFRR